MAIKSINITNFRNHKTLQIDFDPKVTWVIGDNGTGKTNILEAIHMLSTTRPFRGDFDLEVINFDQSFAKLEGVIDDLVLELTILKTQGGDNTSKKTVKVNKIPKTLHNFSGRVKSVLFCPEDISIITGSPGERRSYMDRILNQISSKYKRATSNYVKALRQRNKLLQSIAEIGIGYDQLDFWDDSLVVNGLIIQQERDALINYWNTKVKEYELTLNKTDTDFELYYLKNDISKERLEINFPRDLLAQTTLSGPHRDDFEIRMDGKNISNFGSRGQQRTALLALKLSEIDYIYQQTQENPLLLLDDIFSELDLKHKEAVLETIKNKQTIITGADKTLPQILQLSTEKIIFI